MPRTNIITTITVTDGADYNIGPNNTSQTFVISGTAVLTGNWRVLMPSGYKVGMECTFMYNANVTLGGNHIYVLGSMMPDGLATKACMIKAVYSGIAAPSWKVTFHPDFEETDIVATDDIADNAVTNAKLAGMTRGHIKLGNATGDPSDYNASTSAQILIGDGSDLVSVPVTGDIGITAGGVVTIANDSVDNNMLANMARGTIKVGGVANAPTDLAAQTLAQILIGDGTDVVSVPVTGDITITAAGVVTVTNLGPIEAGAGTGALQTDSAVTGCNAAGNYSVSTGLNSVASANVTLSHGNASTASSVDAIALGNNALASGIRSVSIGYLTKAQSVDAVAIGDSATASAPNTIAIGNSPTASQTNAVAIGRSALSSAIDAYSFGVSVSAKGDNSLAMGTSATAPEDGVKVWSSGAEVVAGDNQTYEVILSTSTTGAVADYLQLPDGTDGIPIPTDCVSFVEIILVGVITASGGGGAVGDSFIQKIEYAIQNNGGTTAVLTASAATTAGVHTKAANVIYKDSYANTLVPGAIAASADDPNDRLQISVTGVALDTVGWTAYVKMFWRGYNTFSI